MRGRATPAAFSRQNANACIPERLEIPCDASLMETARDVTLRLQDLLGRERVALSDFLVALADFDRRRLWVELGHSSLFYFLCRELGLSKGAAFYRKTAAELLQRFPRIVEPLRDGRLCLTTIVELSKVLTPENEHEVLPRFFHASKAEAKEVTAELLPVEAAPRRDVMTAAPPATPALLLSVPPAHDPDHALVHPANQRVTDVETPPACSAPLPVPRPASDSIEPLTAELSRIHLTAPRRLVKKLEAAKAAVSHSHPGASLADVVEVAIDLLLERKTKRNGLVKRPLEEPRPSTDPDHIPAHVRRTVHKRDGGKCQWPVESGGVCGSEIRPELHHRTSRARGGPSTPENLVTYCGFHHGIATRREFGVVRRRACRRPPHPDPLPQV